MLENNPFYWGSVRKVVVAFGAVFSDIHIVRFDAKGNPAQKIEVPCEFGPKEKWMTRNIQNPMPGTDDAVEMVLPRMSYEINSFTYDPERKLTSTGQTVRVLTVDEKLMKAQYNPVPYNIGFTLNIMTKTIEDGLMIVEQIIPFFTPDYTITVKDVPELDLLKDLPIIMNGMSYEDTWDGAMNQRRTVTWTLQFTVKAYLYPPVRLSKVNLRTTILWHLSNNLIPTVVDQFLPEAGTTKTENKIIHVPDNSSPTNPPGQAGTYQEKVVGGARIGLPFPVTTNGEEQLGSALVTNPLNIQIGFQDEPLGTLETRYTMKRSQQGSSKIST